MSKPFWLSKLTPSELKLMHDLADVIRATGLKGLQDPITIAALINQEMEQREGIQNDIILSESPDRAHSDSSTPSPSSERRKTSRRRLS
jgi:hypothetical protein